MQTVRRAVRHCTKQRQRHNNSDLLRQLQQSYNLQQGGGGGGVGQAQGQMGNAAGFAGPVIAGSVNAGGRVSAESMEQLVAHYAAATGQQLGGNGFGGYRPNN